MDEPKMFGAPPKRDPKPGERFQLGIRVTPELKRRLDAAAEESGRSQSQEAEIRLEKSFDREDLLPEVLTIAYGSKEVAGLLMLIGFLMNHVGDFVHFAKDDIIASTRGRRRRLRFFIQRHGPFDITAEHWTSNPHAFDQALQGAIAALQAARPAGKRRDLLREPGTGMPYGVLVADQVLDLFLRKAPHGKQNNLFAIRARKVRQYLGGIAFRQPLFVKRSIDDRANAKVAAPPAVSDAKVAAPLAVSEAESVAVADAILKLINSRPRTPYRDEIARVLMSEVKSLAQKEPKL